MSRQRSRARNTPKNIRKSHEPSRDDIVLSILIPSVPQRHQQLGSLLEDLQQQIGDLPVEVLVLTDNRKSTTGAKRNHLIQLALGKYVAAVDDDDIVSPDYIRSLYNAITIYKCDCIVFDVLRERDGKEMIIRFGKDYQHRTENNVFYRKPNHLMCIRREIAQTVSFNNSCHEEDTTWASSIAPKIRTEHRIKRTLYTYRCQIDQSVRFTSLANQTITK